MDKGIIVKNLSFAYPDTKDQVILKDINLKVENGEFVCLLGKSGCGKSTFLRLLAGLESPGTGEILIEGETVKSADLSKGVVFQDYGLFPWMTAGDNILLALQQKNNKESKKKTKKELQSIVFDMLEMVGLERSVYTKLPKELSRGMKQRCALARALSVNPPILLMDEPFGALDAVTRAKLQDSLYEIWKRLNKTIIFVTHDVEEALLLSNHIIVLGQSPSNIIYECKISSDGHATRENQFKNEEVLKLRSQLIWYINKDLKKICPMIDVN